MDPHPSRSDLPPRPDVIVRHTTAMVVVTNRRREIEWVNPAFTRVTGWTLEEVRGRHPRLFLHGPRTSPLACMRLRELLRRGAPVTDFELINYTKAGTPFWVALNIVPVHDDAGQVHEYVSIQSDITERKRREAESAQTLRRLLRAKRLARLGYVEHDLASGRVHCSARVHALLDSPGAPPVLDYDALMQRVHPDDAAAVRAAYEAAVNAGTPFESEHRIVSFAGRVHWVRLHGELEGWDDGTPALFRCVVQDVTALHAEAQRAREHADAVQATQAQQALLARLGRALRAPLQGVTGLAATLAREEGALLSPRAREQLQCLAAAARQALDMAQAMTELAPLGANPAFLAGPPEPLAPAGPPASTAS